MSTVVTFPAGTLPRARAPISTLRSRVLAVCDGLTPDELRIVVDSCERLAGARPDNMIVAHAAECADMLRSPAIRSDEADRVSRRVAVLARQHRIRPGDAADILSTALSMLRSDVSEADVNAWARDYMCALSGPTPPEAA